MVLNKHQAINIQYVDLPVTRVLDEWYDGPYLICLIIILIIQYIHQYHISVHRSMSSHSILLVTSYGDINLGQHWLRFVAWRYQAIASISEDLSSKVSYECWGISDHQQHNCLCNNLLSRLTTKKIQKFCIGGSFWGEGIHQGPAMRNGLPCYDVTMAWCRDPNFAYGSIFFLTVALALYDYNVFCR